MKISSLAAAVKIASWVVLLLAQGCAAQSAEIRVLSVGPLRTLLQDLGPQVLQPFDVLRRRLRAADNQQRCLIDRAHQL